MDETLMKIPNSNNNNNFKIEEVDENKDISLSSTKLIRSSNEYNISSNESSELTSSSTSSLSENLILNSTLIDNNIQKNVDDIKNDIIMSIHTKEINEKNVQLYKEPSLSLSSTTSNEEDDNLKSLDKDEDILLNRTTSRNFKRKLNDEINKNLSLLDINSVESTSNADMDDSIENLTNNNGSNIARQTKLVKYDINENNGTLPVKQINVKIEDISDYDTSNKIESFNNKKYLDIFTETHEAVNKFVSQKDLSSTFSYKTGPYRSNSQSSTLSHTFNSENENFSIVISNNDQIIESTSNNINIFINFIQSEMISKSIYSYVHSSDHNKFKMLFNSNNMDQNLTCNNMETKYNNLNDNKPFNCQFLIKTNNQDSSKNPILLNKYENMTVTPIQYDQASVLLKIKPISSVPIPLTSPTKKSNEISTVPSTTSNAYDTNYMDQFTTKMTLKGQLLWADGTNLKNSFNINDTNSTTTTTTTTSNSATKNNNGGFLQDFNNRKPNVTIFDYVHNNDLSHLNKHILDVTNKGENTSSIYRLKITEKHAFVQSNSKLVPFERNDPQIIHLDDLDEQKKIIISTHSIIKEIDSEVEMKGSASTSLMKILISKKPNNNNNNNNNNSKSSLYNAPTSPSNLLKLQQSIELDDSSSIRSQNQVGQLNKTASGQSPNSQTTNPPIGTKFAFTMLGLNTNPSSFDSSNVYSSKNTNNNKNSSTSFQKSNSYKNSINDFDDNNLKELKAELELNENLEETEEFLEETKILKSESSDSSLRNSKNSNILLKKLLSQSSKKSPTSPVSSFLFNEKKLTETADDKDLNLVNNIKKERLSVDIIRQDSFSPSNSNLDKNQEKELKEYLKSKLPSSSSSSPLNKSHANTKGQNSLLKSKDDIILRALLNTSDLEPQVLQLESVFELSNTNNTNSNNQAENRSPTLNNPYSRSYNNQNMPPHHNDDKILSKSLSSTSSSLTILPTGHQNKKLKQSISINENQQEEKYSGGANKSKVPKKTKKNSTSSITKEKTSNKKSLQFQHQQFNNEQPNNNYQNQQQLPTKTWSNQTNTINQYDNILVEDSLLLNQLDQVFNIDDITPSTESNNPSSYQFTTSNSSLTEGLNLNKDLLNDPFSQNIQTPKYTFINSNLNTTNNSNYSPSTQLQNIYQNSITTNPSTPTTPTSMVNTAQLIPKSRNSSITDIDLSSSTPNISSTNVNNLNSTNNKDDDITKQKRIEAITKHLKTDLIESFKALIPTNNNQIKNQSSPNGYPSPQQQSNMNSNAFVSFSGDNNVPNLTIDSNIQNNPILFGSNNMASPPNAVLYQTKIISPSQQQKMRNFSGGNLSSNQQLLISDEFCNEDLLFGGNQTNNFLPNQHLSSQTNSPNHQNTNNGQNLHMNNEPSYLRKKLQETIMLRNNSIPVAPSSINSNNNTNVAVVSPSPQIQQKNPSLPPPPPYQSYQSSSSTIHSQTNQIIKNNIESSSAPSLSYMQGVQQQQQQLKQNQSLQPPPSPQSNSPFSLGQQMMIHQSSSSSNLQIPSSATTSTTTTVTVTTQLFPASQTSQQSSHPPINPPSPLIMPAQKLYQSTKSSNSFSSQQHQPQQSANYQYNYINNSTSNAFEQPVLNDVIEDSNNYQLLNQPQKQLQVFNKQQQPQQIYNLSPNAPSQYINICSPSLIVNQASDFYASPIISFTPSSSTPNSISSISSPNNNNNNNNNLYSNNSNNKQQQFNTKFISNQPTRISQSQQDLNIILNNNVSQQQQQFLNTNESYVIDPSNTNNFILDEELVDVNFEFNTIGTTNVNNNNNNNNTDILDNISVSQSNNYNTIPLQQQYQSRIPSPSSNNIFNNSNDNNINNDTKPQLSYSRSNQIQYQQKELYNQPQYYQNCNYSQINVSTQQQQQQQQTFQHQNTTQILTSQSLMMQNDDSKCGLLQQLLLD